MERLIYIELVILFWLQRLASMGIRGWITACVVVCHDITTTSKTACARWTTLGIKVHDVKESA